MGVFLMALAAIMPFFSVSASQLLGRMVVFSERFMPAFINRALARLTDAVAAFQGLALKRVLTVVVCLSLCPYYTILCSDNQFSPAKSTGQTRTILDRITGRERVLL